VYLKRPECLCQRTDGVVHVLRVQANNHGVIALARELGIFDPLNVGSNIELAHLNLNGRRVRVAAQRKDLGLQLIQVHPERRVGRQPLHQLPAQGVLTAAPAWESVAAGEG
jgi:hypothetical protein